MNEVDNQPKALDAERAVLGLMMLAPATADAAFEKLKVDDFFLPAHSELFMVLYGLYMRGEPIELRSVVLEATRSNTLGRLPGREGYIIDLYSTATVPESIVYYITQIVSAARKRKLIQASMQIHQRALSPTSDAEEVGSFALSTITQAASEHLPDSAVSAAEAMAMAIERAEGLADGSISRTGLSYGYPYIDDLTGGIHPGQLVLIAGRPGLGKSVAALDVARSVAIGQGRPVMLCSLEMSRLEIGQRLVAATAGVPLKSLIQGTLTQEQRQAADEALVRVATAPLLIDDSADMTTADLRAKAARESRRNGLDLIIVDYLGLLGHPLRNKVESRQVMVSDLSRDLKLIAKSIAPVVALAQLNRGPELRADKKPQLADLRDSGALEQDADAVILVHREDAFDENSPRAGEIDLILAKQRQGATGVETLVFQGHYARMKPMFHS